MNTVEKQYKKNGVWTHYQNAEGEWFPIERPNNLVPIGIIERLTKPGDLVVDPFGGSFTNAAACKKLGRRFIGCDIEKHWAITGQQRIEQMEIEERKVG